MAGDGDERAFELLYDRHHRPLLSFCRHMLGNQEEGEDALQQTFMRALRALRAGQRPDHTRGWLYAIARNCCRDLLVARRDAPSAELDELPSTSGLADAVQARTDLRDMLADVARLPDEQRAALVLAELGDLSQDQIGEVLGVRRERVKSLVYQARHTLIAERAARSESCADIRAELSVAHGPQLRRGRLKRHLRVCDGCRAFHREVGTQHAAFAVLLPVVAGEALHGKVLGTALAAAKGATAVGGAAAGASALASAGTGAGAGAGLSAAGSGVTVAGVATKATLAKLGVVALVAGAATGGVVAVDDGVGHARPGAARRGRAGLRPQLLVRPHAGEADRLPAALNQRRRPRRRAADRGEEARAQGAPARAGTPPPSAAPPAPRAAADRAQARAPPVGHHHAGAPPAQGTPARAHRASQDRSAAAAREAPSSPRGRGEHHHPGPAATAPSKPRRRLHRRAASTA